MTAQHASLFGASERSQDWKENTGILDQDTQTQPEIPRQTIQQREIKADIIELIDHQGIQKHKEIITQLEHDQEDIEKAIKQLQKENVLQKTRGGQA